MIVVPSALAPASAQSSDAWSSIEIVGISDGYPCCFAFLSSHLHHPWPSLPSERAERLALAGTYQESKHLALVSAGACLRGSWLAPNQQTAEPSEQLSEQVGSMYNDEKWRASFRPSTSDCMPSGSVGCYLDLLLASCLHRGSAFCPRHSW